MGEATFSVVIPNLDGARWLEPCLSSLAAGSVRPDEVIVADDGSRDDSAHLAERHGARFLPAPRRATGFAASVNRGVAVARGRWLVLLNNDTEVDPGALAALRDAARRHPDAAALAPLVRSLRDRRSIDSAGLLVYPDGVARPRWHGLADAPGTPVEEEVLLPSGAACALRADWLGRVGPLDESMGSYLEDVDWGLRAQRAGAHVWFVPSALVYHHFSGTVGPLSPFKARSIERNRVVVVARHLPLRMLLASPAWTLVRWVLLLGARDPSGASRESPARLGLASLAGLASGLGRLPRALSERRRLRENGIGDAELARRLRAHRASAGDLRRYGA